MSMYGDREKDEMLDEIEGFLKTHSLFELLNIVTDASLGYVKKDYESDLNKENIRLKQELADMKEEIRKLSDKLLQ